MVKIIIGFVVLAAAVLFVLNQGGHVEMGGEHAGQEASAKAGEKPEAPAAAAPSPTAPAAPAKN
jgi:pyrimidine deaminase RibD-like protein